MWHWLKLLLASYKLSIFSFQMSFIELQMNRDRLKRRKMTSSEKDEMLEARTNFMQTTRVTVDLTVMASVGDIYTHHFLQKNSKWKFWHLKGAMRSTQQGPDTTFECSGFATTFSQWALGSCHSWTYWEGLQEKIHISKKETTRVPAHSLKRSGVLESGEERLTVDLLVWTGGHEPASNI